MDLNQYKSVSASRITIMGGVLLSSLRAYENSESENIYVIQKRIGDVAVSWKPRKSERYADKEFSYLKDRWEG